MAIMIDNPDLTANLEYVRRLYKEVLEWYRNADSKAQVIITLDGIFVTVVTPALFQTPDLRAIHLRWYTLILLGLTAITLSLSLYHAVSCMRSRIYNHQELTGLLNELGVDRCDYHTYKPGATWFFQLISALDKTQFEKRMREMEPGFEIDVMASQIYVLSANVSKKHSHVNRGFSYAALTFLLFVLSGLSTLINI